MESHLTSVVQGYIHCRTSKVRFPKVNDFERDSYIENS
jgi:hypothetical protein